MTGATIDVAAGDRAAERVVVFGNRLGKPLRVAALLGLKAMASFDDVPAPILAALAGRLKVDPLVAVLADVGDVQIAGGAVEGEAPGVAQPVRPDLGAGAWLADEG